MHTARIKMPLLVMCSIVLVGCVQFNQPSTYNVEKEFVISLDKVEAASRVKRWLLQNGFIITENTPTLITAKISSLDQLQGYAHDTWKGISYTNVVVDCGRIVNANVIGYGTNGAQISVSMDDDNGSTGGSGAVTSKEGTRVFVSFVPTVNTAVARTCVSTGSIERTFKQLLTN